MSETKKNASDVADYFIYLSNESGESITNLKLQKLVYYAQAWFLAIFEKPIFEEDFEAWVHGPVIPVMYEQYKSFGSAPIIASIDFDSLKVKIGDILDYLDELAKVYMPCGAYQLEMMTHKEDPWIIARGDCAPDERCNNVIKKDDMQKYYGEKAKN